MEKKELNELEEDKLQSMVRQRPYVVQTIQTQILYDLASMMNDLRKDIQATIHDGIVESITVSVTDKVTKLSRESDRELYLPWRAATIFNDGPQDVYITINKPHTQSTTPLREGESMSVNMDRPRIRKVLLTCDEGETASVRIIYQR